MRISVLVGLRAACAGMLAAGWLSGWTGEAAEAPGGGGEGVEGIVAEVLRVNPELRAYEAALAAAREGHRVAGRLERPVLGGEVGRIRSHNLDGTLAGEGVVWSASLQQTFEWPGRLALRKAIANEDVALATLGLERFRQAVGGRARWLALRSASAEEQVRVTREVSDRFRSLREVLVQRDSGGITPALEIRILEATELGLRRRAGDRELEAVADRVELNLMRGHSATNRVMVRLEGPRFEALPTDMDLLAGAFTNNLELRTRLSEVAQQGFRVALARNERWPSFTVGPAYTAEDGSSRDRLLTFGVQVPLPLWRNTEGNVAAAEARRLQAEATLQAARRELERQVLVGAQRFSVRQEEMGRWREDSVERFREAAELADRHYRLGAVPAATYVELQKQYLEAVETLIETRMEALSAALELEQLTGLRLVRAGAAKEERP